MTWVGIKKDDIKPDMYLELSEHPLVSSNVGIISIKNQVEIQIQASYSLNSSISAQSTVRFGSTCISTRSSGRP